MMDMLPRIKFYIFSFMFFPLIIGQDERKCSYTFNVPVADFTSQCVTSEIRQTLDELHKDNKKILSENVELREQIENLFKEYGDMIETVKTLKSETATWRQVIEWPVYDTPFNPNEPGAIIDQSTTYYDCYQALRKKSPKKPGLYTLQPKDAQHPFLAYCDKDGWTVLLRRYDGKVDFDKSWTHYSGGFGEISGEHWIGLENIYLMTASRDYQLRVEALGYNNKLYEGEWDNFKVGNELEKYLLTVDNMTEGNYIDVMSPISGLQFSTKDSDNDKWYQSGCAEQYKGGWWLDDCGFDPTRPWCDGNGCMTWGELHIKKIVLKIRPMIAKGTTDKVNGKPVKVKPPLSKSAKNPSKKYKKNKKSKNKNKKGQKDRTLF